MFIRYVLLLFIIKTCCFTETSSQSLPGCQERCGSVAIPYPFGIGRNCSAHDTYSITCNTSFNPPKPFITSINLEVLEISLRGTVHINNPVFDSCNNRTEYLTLNFTNTPFTYSTTATRFTAIGCDNLALIHGPTNVLGGCISICNDTFQESTCYGVLCCQTNIPPSLKFIKASVGSIESRKDQHGCKYAFMVDVDWFGNLTSIFNVLESSSIPAVLDWRLSGNCSAFGPLESGSNTSVCDNRSRAFCSNQSVCSCPQGYEGNPYLRDGCQDIDECASSSANDCKSNCTSSSTNECESYCINIPGSYICYCSNGYFVNGKCMKLQENNKMKTILIGCVSGLGGLLLLFAAWWVYKIMKRRKEDMLKRVCFKRNGGLLLQQQMSSGEDGNFEKPNSSPQKNSRKPLITSARTES